MLMIEACTVPRIKLSPLVQGFVAMISEIWRPSIRWPPSRWHELQEGFANSSKTLRGPAEINSFEEKVPEKEEEGCINNHVCFCTLQKVLFINSS